MKRRTFIEGGVAAIMCGFLCDYDFAARTLESANSPRPHLLTAQMIWNAGVVPIPLKTNGPASRIASSSAGHKAIEVSDLHAVFAREFHLDTLPSKALIRLFCYTRYRLYVNGIYCGRGPSRFQNQRPEYDERSIAAFLRRGRNVVAVLVHRDAPTGRIMNHEPGLAAVVVLGDGGSATCISTNPSWRSMPERSFGPRDQAWSSIEEHIDAREGLDLTSPDFAPAGWPASVLVGGPDFFPIWPRTTPLQIEVQRAWNDEQMAAQQALKPGEEQTFDLTEIIQGYHDISFDAGEGSEIEISYLLPQGERSGRSTYIARAGLQRYIGGDTFAFDRLSIRLLKGKITVRSATAVEVRYPFQRLGAFECSEPFLNQLWTVCARSLEILSEDSYVDCADRERVEWTDDSPPAFDCTRVMMRGPDEEERQHWGDSRLLKALLRRISLTQVADGQMKAHSCSERWDIHAIMEDRSCDWVVQLREYFKASGDRQFVREMWPALNRLIEWFLRHRTQRGLILAREWEVWDNPLRYQVCEGAGLNALVYRALCDSAYLGEQIGELDRSKILSREAARLFSDFNELLWNPGEGTYDGALFGPGSKTAEQLNGRMFSGPIIDGHYKPTVQAALFALYSEVVPEERIASVRQWVLSHLDGVEGPMSHYYLFHALYQMEQEERDREVLACMIVGWKNQVDSPWQTTWESLKDDGGSKVHVYGLVPGYFLTTAVLGARRMGPVSLRTIVVEPRCSGLSWARGTAVTEFGPVEMDWSKNQNGVLSIACTLPADVTARLRLYRIDGKDSISLDGKPIPGTKNGAFIEATFAGGRHHIAYPC